MTETIDHKRNNQDPVPGPLSLAIVIPALNEYPGIIDVLKELLDVTRGMIDDGLFGAVEIIVVDDGSTDETASAALSVPDVRVVKHEKNRGYGAALKTGFSSSDADYLAFLDADGTYPPTELPKLCRELLEHNADLVIGSRLSGEPSDMPRVRYWGNVIFARLTTWASGTLVTDCASGMRVFPRTSLPRFYPLPDGLNFTPAMTTRSLLEGLTILQIPMRYHERLGNSKLSAVKDGFRFLGSILRMTTLYNPLKFFGMIGLFLIVLGVAYGVEPLVHYCARSEVPERYIYRLLAILTFWLAGLQIVTVGFLANYILSVIHRQINQQSRIIRFFDRWSAFIRLDVLGGLLIAIAVMLNWKNVIEYFMTGAITSHWSYLLTGTILILSGIHLLSVHILLRILSELKQRDSDIARDLRT